MRRHGGVFFLAILLVAAMAAGIGTAAESNKNVILSTTTSTQDSGLLDVLIPLFEKQTG